MNENMQYTNIDEHNRMYGMHQPRYRKPRKQEIINCFKQTMGVTELDLVDDCTPEFTRHICLGGGVIEILNRKVFLFNTPEGSIPLEYYQCPKCGKAILNRNFM